MLKNTALAAKIGVDTVENRSQKDPDKCTTSRFSLVFVRDVTPYCTLCGLGTLIVHTLQCNLAPLLIRCISDGSGGKTMKTRMFQ